jgi:hypothetical protein
MKLAVIVPYRNRAEHLAEFVPAMCAYLHSVTHHIYVVEQADNKLFNRGKLLNVGFRLVADDTMMARAMTYPVTDFSHVVLHDVDMLPEEVLYSPVDRPTHLAGAASQFAYTLPYPSYFGGVTLFPVADFRRVNGYSNDYWGWGCEDDDLLDRCAHHGIAVGREPGRFRSLAHTMALNDPATANGYSANHQRLSHNRAGQHEYGTNGLCNLGFTLHGYQDISDRATVLRVSL